MGTLDNQRVLESKQKTAELVDENNTLKNILADGNQSALFATYLETNSKAELAEKIQKGELEEADINDLSGYRAEFVKKMDQITEVQSYVREDNLHSYLAHSEDLQKIVMINGSENTMKALNHHIQLLAFRDPSRFEVLSKKVLDLKAVREGDYAQTESRIQDAANKYRVNENTVAQILLREDLTESQKKDAIREEMKKNLGWWGRIKNFRSLSDGRKEIASLVDGGEARSVIENYNIAAGNIGKALGDTIKMDDDTRKTFAGLLIGERPATLEKGMGFKAAQQELASGKTLESDWEKFLTDNNIDKNTITDTDWAAKVSEFKTEQKDKVKAKKKAGGWLAILFSLFDVKIDQFNPEKK